MATHSKLDVLQRVPVFSRCSRSELEWIARQMDEVDVEAGAVLTEQGRPGHTFYVILEGEVDVEIDGTARAKLTAGDFFGEISMLDRGPSTATCKTLTPCKFLVMSHEQFRNAVKSNDDVLAAVMAAMAERLRENAAAGLERNN
jgi:CRP-like cAMP-binding protein